MADDGDIPAKKKALIQIYCKLVHNGHPERPLGREGSMHLHAALQYDRSFAQGDERDTKQIMTTTTDSKRDLLRHTVATLAYRGAKAVRGAPAEFADFKGAEKTPAQILTHIGDLLDWALSMANGKRQWRDSTPLPWEGEVNRFFSTLRAFDDYLASAEPLQAPVEKLFQGPVADALAHVGQIAMLRRLARVPIKAENFFVADVAAGRVGPEQTPPKREF